MNSGLLDWKSSALKDRNRSIILTCRICFKLPINTVGLDHSFNTYAKVFRKTSISYPLIRTRTCAFQVVSNISFLENFAHVQNEWLLSWCLVLSRVSSNFHIINFKHRKLIVTLSNFETLRKCLPAGSFVVEGFLMIFGHRLQILLLILSEFKRSSFYSPGNHKKSYCFLWFQGE